MARLSSSIGVVPPHAITSDEDSDDSYYVPSTPFSRRLAQVDPSLYQGNGDDFCTTENLVEAAAFVNHQLSTYGFPSNLQFNGTGEKEAVAIVTAFYKVLQQHQTNTKALLEKSEREVDILNGRLSMLEDELRTEVEKHKNTREELKACKGNLQYTKSQFVHESRKKEQEINGLRDKVQKAMNDRFNKSNIGVTLLNPPLRRRQSQFLPSQPKSLSTPGNTPSKTENELLLDEVLSQQRDKEVEIVAENEQLRRTLYTVHIELKKFLHKYGTSKDKDSSPNVYGLPFNMVKGKIEAEIRDQLTSLGDQWTHRPAPEPTISPTELVVRDQQIQDLQKEVEKLEFELTNSTKLIQGAQTMIDNMANSQLLNGIQQFKLQLEESEMTAPELDEAQAEIQQQREQLAKEREHFTQACLDLGRQREQLNKERSEFEASKLTFQLEEFLAYLDDNGGATRNAPDHTRDPSFSSPPAPSYLEQQSSTDPQAKLGSLPRTLQQSRAASTKRVATAPASAFQPPFKKPMISKLSHHVGAGQLYPPLTEDVEESEGGQESVHDETAQGYVDDTEEEFLPKTPTRSLGRLDHSLGLRDIVKSNAMAAMTGHSRDASAMMGQKHISRQMPSSGNESRGTTSDQTDQRALENERRATPAAPSFQSRETVSMPSSTGTRPATMFSRRPPSTSFSFRSALSLGSARQQNQQERQQPRPSSTVAASEANLKASGVDTRSTATAAAAVPAKQPTVQGINSDTPDRRLSLKSSVRLTPALSRAASSIAARKQSQLSHDHHEHSTSVDPLLMFTSPSVSLSNRPLTREHQTPLTPSLTPSTSAVQPASSTDAPLATTTVTSASRSQGGLPAAQRRQQIYESNRLAFMTAQTPK
ncbi:hypothetical protein BGZ73_002485 [Actinomortierella ambigua]|nr:hypothetical protein BGZ73_002485 [Actinomortierella ambigua]